MSAAATANAGVPDSGKKKLIVILVAVLALVLVGGAALVVMKKNAAAQSASDDYDDDYGYEDEELAEAPRPKSRKVDLAHPPTFLPMETFVVNLADKDAERYAQVGVTLQVDDPKVAEQLKAYMPAIRNGILMVLAHKTSTELLDREGKERLAREILREASAPLGYEVDTAGKRRRSSTGNPITGVHFSNFIIQ